MPDPCHYCVQPERYPGCHDHCEKLKTYHESDDYKKLCKYKNTYFKSHSIASSAKVDKMMRYKARKGCNLGRFKGVGDT